MPGRYALIVAGGAYSDPKLSRLRTPTRDAEELARVLRDPEIGDFEVELMVDAEETALRRRVARFFSDRARDDLLLLHFSCHGLKDDSGQLYFAATDTEVAQLDATAVSAEFVSRQMTRSRSRKVTPSMSSPTSSCLPSTSTTSWTIRMFGWLSAETASASRRKRATPSGSPARCGGRSLKDTRRSSVGSCAR